ncbi:MAG: hypothetical protein GC180_12875 [Bacteroidetes bacterium]|nr:hypothetical protein [Bacteroidota bacterium]
MISVPADKDYRMMDEIILGKSEIEELSLKAHPLQAWFVEAHPEISFDDCFSLPLPYLRGFHDAFLCYKKEGAHSKGFATASFETSLHDPWFYCHFPGDPVMPGSQGQDLIFQLAGLWATLRAEVIGRPRALEGNFNFHGQILPTSKKIFYRMDVKRSLKKLNLLFFDGTVAVDDPDNIIYDFHDCKIGFFTKEQLGIHQRANEYYQPDWNHLKETMNDAIDQSKNYYDRNGKK